MEISAASTPDTGVKVRSVDKSSALGAVAFVLAVLFLSLTAIKLVNAQMAASLFFAGFLALLTVAVLVHMTIIASRNRSVLPWIAVGLVLIATCVNVMTAASIPTYIGK